MEFQLIDSELSEARLYRGTRQFSTLSGRDIANLAYLNTLSLWILAQDETQSGYARAYAEQTAQYGAYSLFRTHATDLYMLCYQICNPNNDHVKLDNELESKRFIKNLSFFDKRHIQFMRKIAIGKDDVSEANSFFLRLESQLSISDGRYKRWRRVGTDWRNLKDIQKSTLLHQIGQEIKRTGRATARTSEILVAFDAMYKYSKFPNKSVDKVDIKRRVVGTPKKSSGIKKISDFWASRVKK